MPNDVAAGGRHERDRRLLVVSEQLDQMRFGVSTKSMDMHRTDGCVVVWHLVSYVDHRICHEDSTM